MLLVQCKVIIEGICKNSQDVNQSKDMVIMDVNVGVIDVFFVQIGIDVLIYGYMYCFVLYCLEGGKLCYVLLDWEYDVEMLCGGWISLMVDGVLYWYDVNGDEIV